MLCPQIATGVTSSQPIKLVQVPQTTTYIPTTQPTIVSTVPGTGTAHLLVCVQLLPPLMLSRYKFGGLNCSAKMPSFAVQHFLSLMPHIRLIGPSKDLKINQLVILRVVFCVHLIENTDNLSMCFDKETQLLSWTNCPPRLQSGK